LIGTTPFHNSTRHPVYGGDRGFIRVWSNKHRATRQDSRSDTMFPMTTVTKTPWFSGQSRP
jgi:hypothetical protein